ncbi:MAG: phosphodiester glycosidase family protein [Oscillospiraceae bacterium]|nr:phosphodiester glycosidase family protein [Oscillospiraceae bacterium]
MKNRHMHRVLALLLAAGLILGLCSCSRLEDYMEQEERQAPTEAGTPAEQIPASAQETVETPAAETAEEPVSEPEAPVDGESMAAPVEEPAAVSELDAEAGTEPAAEIGSEPVTDVPAQPETANLDEAGAAPETDAAGEAVPETAEPAAEDEAESDEEPAAEEDAALASEDLGYVTLEDEDGDGIINYKFFYKGATVYALIVLDPSRVFVGTALTQPVPWGQGLTLDQMAEKYEAVAGINAGGFVDEEGGGMGWPPRGITFGRGTVFEGEQYGPVAALDNDNHMWAGYYDFSDCMAIGIRDAVCFGPCLVENGVKTDPSQLEEGIGARTAIGQREDGAIVMVAIDGRQGYSIGVTFEDCVNIMADKFGCVNASNMDGGNSTCMYYDGQAVNRSSNQAGGTRYLPDAWLVSALPEDYVRPEGVPTSVAIPENALGEVKHYVGECDDETKERMYTFAWVFTKAYYGYFGTPYYERHYSDMLQYVAQDCELRDRAKLALMDRKWVNTWGTEPANIVVDGAYINEDGSYDILITLDVIERSAYWNYEAKGIQLRITVVDAPSLPYGFLVTNTY